MFEVIPYGPQAWLVNFEQIIDPGIHAQVLSVKTMLEVELAEPIAFLIPAYASLTIGFETEKAGKTIYDYVQGLKETSLPHHVHGQGNIWEIPVCYEAPYALDKDAIQALTGLLWEEVVHMHTREKYQVYMLGFRPGFGYMGKLPDRISLPRKQTPRLQVPGCSVGIAGSQTGIYPVEAPGGWQIVGRCPISPFQPQQEDPFLFSVGDSVQFVAVTEAKYQYWQALHQAGSWQREMWHGEG
ncbi:MAG: 5-oxoprolinase subunit PxpB [Bacteroidota bacterium]